MDLEFTLVVNVAGEDTPKVRDDVRRTVEQTLGVAADATTRRSSGPVWVSYLVTPPREWAYGGLTSPPRPKAGCPYPMTPEEYRDAEGGQCPNCGDPQTMVEYRGIDFEGGGMYQRADCSACGFSWFDAYSLTGYVVLEVPSGEPGSTEV